MHSPWRTFLVAALATAVALAAFGASSALAAPREIAYRCGGDICLLDPDNPSAVTNLTNNGNTSLEETPVWSGDGTKLAFISRLNGTRNVYLMNPNATAGEGIGVALQVTHYSEGGFLGDPIWSPDGSRIAFVRGVDEGSRSILVAAADGTTATPVTVTEHGQHPSWAPDGGKIAYSYGKQVFLKNADGGGIATPLENGAGREPAWSPDGSRIAFDFPAHPAEFVDLHIVSSIGGGTPVIVPSATQWTFAAWSPGGTQVAYRSTSENFGYFRVVNADGSGDHGLPVVTGLNDNGPEPSWSPDSSRLVFQGFGSGKTDVYVTRTDGSGPVLPLTTDGDGNEPVWRPNPAFRPPVTVPSNGSAAPIPKTIHPKYFWIKTGIPWAPTQVTIIVGSYGCGGPSCSVSTEGKMKSAAPILPPRPFSAAASAKKTGKPRAIIVAHGKMKVPAGKTKPLKLTLTKQGIAVLKQRGSLKIALTVTATATGYKKRVDHHTVKVVREAAKKHMHG